MNNTLLASLQANIGDHIPATQREERVSEREKGEIITVSVEVRGKRSLDPNKRTAKKSGPSPLRGFHERLPGLKLEGAIVATYGLVERPTG
jgi:hypothetical protein